MHHRLASSSRRGFLYVTLAGIAWGTGGPTGALLFDHAALGSTAVSFWRLAAAALWLALARLVLRRAPIRPLLSASPLRYLLTGLGLAVCQLGYFAAIPQVGVALATVIALGAGPFFIALGARERITPALVAAVAGLTLLVPSGGGGSAALLGIAFALLSAAGYALTTLLNRNESDPITGAFLGFVAGALLLLPLAIIDGIMPTAPGWPLIAYFGLVPTALAYTLFYASLTTLRASTAAVIALIEPVVAATLGILLLHEHLTTLSAVGTAVLLAAVLLHARRE
jgi:DME family drug/metabolite transporter